MHELTCIECNGLGYREICGEDDICDVCAGTGKVHVELDDDHEVVVPMVFSINVPEYLLWDELPF